MGWVCGLGVGGGGVGVGESRIVQQLVRRKNRLIRSCQ